MNMGYKTEPDADATSPSEGQKLLHLRSASPVLRTNAGQPPGIGVHKGNCQRQLLSFRICIVVGNRNGNGKVIQTTSSESAQSDGVRRERMGRDKGREASNTARSLASSLPSVPCGIDHSSFRLCICFIRASAAACLHDSRGRATSSSIANCNAANAKERASVSQS